MYFVNYLNRNKTDPYYPAFEVIYGIEVHFLNYVGQLRHEIPAVIHRFYVDCWMCGCVPCAYNHEAAPAGQKNVELFITHIGEDPPSDDLGHCRGHDLCCL